MFGPNTLLLTYISASYALLAIIAKELSLNFGVQLQIGLRMAIAFIISLIFFNAKQIFSKVSGWDWGIAIIKGFLMSGVAGGLWILALKSTSIGVVTAVSNLPLETLLGILFFKEKITRKQLILLITAFCGFLLVLDLSDPVSLLSSGAFLAFLSGLAWAIGIAMIRLHSKEVTPIISSQLIQFVGAVLCLALFYFVDQQISLPETVFPWAILVLSALMVLVSTNLLSYLIPRIPLSLYSISVIMQTPFAVLFGYLFFRELPTVQQGIGVAVIVGSTWASFKK